MTFHDSQLGRFGELCSAHFGGHGDPDVRAAHALASNGVSAPTRPNLGAVYGTKILNEDTDPAWLPWAATFGGILAGYQTSGGGPLPGQCPATWPQLPAGFCMHELTPPLRYWSMRSFSSRLRTSNVITRADGTIGVDPSIKPTWNYVVIRRGEILVGAEDFGWIKHTSLAAGQSVWAAGEIGIENGQLRLVNLQSGHYVTSGAANITPGSALAIALTQFVEDAVKEYYRVFKLPNLHSAFKCVWV
jgi:hypothetical protein